MLHRRICFEYEGAPAGGPWLAALFEHLKNDCHLETLELALSTPVPTAGYSWSRPQGCGHFFDFDFVRNGGRAEPPRGGVSWQGRANLRARARVCWGVFFVLPCLWGPVLMEGAGVLLGSIGAATSKTGQDRECRAPSSAGVLLRAKSGRAALATGYWLLATGS